jgi:hypothetical protein
MGCTHYWRGTESDLDERRWRQAIHDCDMIIAFAAPRLSLDVSHRENYLSFNGNGDTEEECEPFLMWRDVNKMRTENFAFCKTRAYPYDTAVVACLARLAEAGLKVSSDGNQGDWQDGLAMAKDCLGREVPMPELGR